jgi:hypothetical protein
MEHRLAEEAAEAVEAVAPKKPARAVAADPTGPRWRHPLQRRPRQLPFPRITP